MKRPSTLAPLAAPPGGVSGPARPGATELRRAARFDRFAPYPLKSNVYPTRALSSSATFPTMARIRCSPMIRYCTVTTLTLLFSAAVAAQVPAPAGDPAKGREKTRMCEGCHGIEGWRTAFPEVYRVPKLGGQKPEYIVAALKAYKKGERDFATMRAIASELSDQDMADVAAYYGAENPTVAEKKK